MQNYLGADIAKLGFGLMRLPSQAGQIDLEQVKRMVDAFLAAGFTYFDTAYVYNDGDSEIAAREALVSRHPRPSFQLATKLPLWEAQSAADLQTLFNTSLERTGAGYFDFYLLHSLDKGKLAKLDDYQVWDFMQSLKSRGLIRHAGFSFHDTADVLDEILTSHPEMEFVQLQINYIDWDSEDVQAGACFEVARRHGTPVIIMEPVRGGSLAGLAPDIRDILKTARPDWSPTAWALNYAASLPGIITILSGMSNLEQLQENARTLSEPTPLTAADRAILAEVVRQLQAIPTIPCTDCRYCLADCPEKINIPGALAAFNVYTIYDNLDSARNHYRWVTNEGGKASACIACGTCEGHCPQHIPIISHLQTIANLLE